MKAWELIEQKGWCQNAYAKDKNGEIVRYHDPEAFFFCVIGAISAVYNGDEAMAAYHKINNAVMGAAKWNDDPERTKEEVIAKLKELDS